MTLKGHAVVTYSVSIKAQTINSGVLLRNIIPGKGIINRKIRQDDALGDPEIKHD